MFEYSEPSFHEVELSPLLVPESEDKADGVLVRGAFYESRDGDLYHAVSIGPTSDGAGYRLVALADGNRWMDNNRLDLNEFTRLESGRVITIKVRG